MNLNRVAVKQNVKQMLKENWKAVLLVVLLISAIQIAVRIVVQYSGIFGDVLSFLLAMPLEVALCSFLIPLVRDKTGNVGNFFASFSGFFKYLLAGVWYGIWIVLWTLLFIIPGFVKSIAYAMYPYILADNPDADIIEALRTSKRMTDGYKLDLWILMLSFFGWYVLIFVAYFGIEMLILDQFLLGATILSEAATRLLGQARLIAALVTIPFSVLLSCYVTGVMIQAYEVLKLEAIFNHTCQATEFGLAEEQTLALNRIGKNENWDRNRFLDYTEADTVYYETMDGVIVSETEEVQEQEK